MQGLSAGPTFTTCSELQGQWLRQGGGLSDAEGSRTTGSMPGHLSPLLNSSILTFYATQLISEGDIVSELHIVIEGEVEVCAFGSDTSHSGRGGRSGGDASKRGGGFTRDSSARYFDRSNRSNRSGSRVGEGSKGGSRRSFSNRGSSNGRLSLGSSR